MRRILLMAVPNQSFEFETSDFRYVINLNQLTDTLLACTIVVFNNSTGDNETLITAFPVAAQQPLIPFNYLSDNVGNFYFQTPNLELPHYSKFDINHRLYYANPVEFEAIKQVVRQTSIPT